MRYPLDKFKRGTAFGVKDAAIGDIYDPVADKFKTPEQ
jgi:hypothetical protein